MRIHSMCRRRLSKEFEKFLQIIFLNTDSSVDYCDNDFILICMWLINTINFMTFHVFHLLAIVKDFVRLIPTF